MDTRKSATQLPDPERDTFLEALLKLKQRPAENTLQSISVYDQFVALHGAVMSVITPLQANPVNFGHGDIGFLAWHRQYLRQFELALQAEVPDVTLPYWDWSDQLGTMTRLFVPEFLSSITVGSPTPVSDGVLKYRTPANERPDWWPGNLRGFEIDPILEDSQGTALRRGSMITDWPASTTDIKLLSELDIPLNNSHPLWAFWFVLEIGHENITPLTHNTAHRYIGGHMAGGFSPNDPIFWMHHANVDRIWSLWQEFHLAKPENDSLLDLWPDNETSPFSGRPAPPGHNADDLMWPWVGATNGYRSASVSQAILNRLQDYSASPQVTVSSMFDHKAMGYEYL